MLIDEIIKEIVGKSEAVMKEIIIEKIKIDFVDIFPRDPEEKEILLGNIRKIGKQIYEKGTGKVFLLNKSIKTKYGALDVIKIRIFDKNKLQRGAPDFLVQNYNKFKNRYLNRKSFNLIKRETYEMIELAVPESDILIYFPNRPISEDFKKGN